MENSFPFEDSEFLAALEERFVDVVNFDQEPERHYQSTARQPKFLLF